MASSTKSENQQTVVVQAEQKKSISMHADIPVWYDCCSCEPEPYWLAAMAQTDDGDSGKDRETRGLSATVHSAPESLS